MKLRRSGKSTVPTADGWLTLPLTPSKIPHLAHFGTVATAGKLFVLGGGNNSFDWNGALPTDEVWSYDFIQRQWTRCAPMLLPRAMFACCLLNGNIVVAGGVTTSWKPTSRAEIYDPENDVWTSIQDLHPTQNTVCSGLVIKGKVHVWQRESVMVQVLDSVKLEWAAKDYYVRQEPIAVVEDVLYKMIHRMIYKQEEDHTWTKVASAPIFDLRFGMEMTSLSDEVFVIGGVLRHHTLNMYMKPLSDVYALNVGKDQLAWRTVAPMTKCCGMILGCTQLTI